MITHDIQTSATGVSNIWSALDEVKQHLRVVSDEHNVSEVLMLVTIRDWVERQLQSSLAELK